MVNNDQEKLAKIFNNVCPAIILANNRIAKLNTQALYDIISTMINNGAIIVGAPDGRNNVKKFNLCIRNPVIVNPIKTPADNVKVIDK